MRKFTEELCDWKYQGPIENLWKITKNVHNPSTNIRKSLVDLQKFLEVGKFGLPLEIFGYYLKIFGSFQVI